MSRLKKWFSSLKKILFPEKSVYKLVGSKKKIDLLVERFYFYMQTLPEARECLALHKEELGPVKEKLKLFLYGWLGGPQTYTKTYGHPRMRMRHLPFAIGALEKEQWLLCMEKALAEFNLKPNLHHTMMSAFTQLADRIQNKE